MINIYRATRGKYLKPVPISEAGLNWVSEEQLPVSMPKKYGCQHPKHWELGTGTRNGQKLYYPTETMFVQKYHLTKKELDEAIKQYDMASIEMPTLIICPNCASKQP